MDNIKIFSNEEFGDVRTMVIDNEPWFVGKDVAEVLGYSNTRDALLSHVDPEDKNTVAISDGKRGNPNQVIINESGLYSLIIGSRLESAKKFKHWVTSEVLPSIRQTGSYHLQNLSTEMKAILMHDEKIVKIENRIDKLEYDIPLYGAEADELSNHVKRKGMAVLGGRHSEAYKDTIIRSKVYRDIYDQIKREFGLYTDDGKPKSYKALKRRYIYDAHEVIDTYEVPKYLAEQIKDANSQIALAV